MIKHQMENSRNILLMNSYALQTIMKFHLPPSLRKTLLACLAAVASVSTPVATSIASGSFAVGLAGYAMIASEAQAEDATYSLVKVEGGSYSGNAPTVTIDGDSEAARTTR